MNNTKQKILSFDRIFVLTGAVGLEPTARGFGDHCSTNCAIPLCQIRNIDIISQKTPYVNIFF